MYMVDGTTPKPPSYIIIGLVTWVEDSETKFIFVSSYGIEDFDVYCELLDLQGNFGQAL